jgi:hypothetical protein
MVAREVMCDPTHGGSGSGAPAQQPIGGEEPEAGTEQGQRQQQWQRAVRRRW